MRCSNNGKQEKSLLGNIEQRTRRTNCGADSGDERTVSKICWQDNKKKKKKGIEMSSKLGIRDIKTQKTIGTSSQGRTPQNA